MMNFYKENFYTVSDLIEVLKTLPQDYLVEAHHESLDSHFGTINDIDVDHEEKVVIVWFA